MRIVSYNILDGGEGRADPLAEVIEAQRPDVVVLVEADNVSVVERIAGRSKMDFIIGQGPKRAGAILSRWTITSSINHALLTDVPFSAFLEANVIDPKGFEWPIFAVHLHPRASEEAEQIREKQLAVLLPRLQPLRAARRPHVIAGDFNANAPRQQIDPERCKPRTKEEWHANGGKIPRRAIQAMLDAGYVDTLHAVNGPVADRMVSFTTQFPEQRVDYIFTHGLELSRIKSAWIEHDRLAKYASDHFPVGVEIE